MSNRPKRTPGANGRATIDIGGMVGAAGGLSPEGGMAGTPDYSQAASALSPEMGQAMQSTVAANSAGSMMNPYATGMQGFTPYKASGWQNLLSKGQAGMQANQLNNQIYAQQLAGQNAMGVQGLQNVGQMDVTRLSGQNQLANTEATNRGQLAVTQQMGDNATQLAEKNTLMKLAEKLGVTPDYLATAMAELNPQQLALAKGSNANNLGMLNMQAQVQKDPSFYTNYLAGQNATAFSPVAKNIAQAPVVGIGQAAFATPYAGGERMFSGGTLGNVTKTSSESFNPATKSMTNTETVSNNSTPPSSRALGPTGFPIVAPQNNRQAIQASPAPSPYAEVGQPEASSGLPISPFGNNNYNIGQPVNPMDNAQEVMKRNLYLRQFLGQQNTNY